MAKDFRPLKTVEDEGFSRISKALIAFGAAHGDHDPRKVIHHRTHLRKQILPTIVEQQKIILSKCLKTVPSYPVFAFSTDMWSDKYKNRSFISLSIHFIDSSWILRCNLLGLVEFQENSKTTKNIRESCKNIIKQYFSNEVYVRTNKIMLNSYCVTDSGSNAVKVYDKRHKRACHNLNCSVR